MKRLIVFYALVCIFCIGGATPTLAAPAITLALEEDNVSVDEGASYAKQFTVDETFEAFRVSYTIHSEGYTAKFDLEILTDSEYQKRLGGDLYKMFWFSNDVEHNFGSTTSSSHSTVNPGTYWFVIDNNEIDDEPLDLSYKIELGTKDEISLSWLLFTPLLLAFAGLAVLRRYQKS